MHLLGNPDAAASAADAGHDNHSAGAVLDHSNPVGNVQPEQAREPGHG